MRHEPGHREAVQERVETLLERFEREALTENLEAAAAILARLRDVCGPVRDYEPLSSVLGVCQDFLDGLGAAKASGKTTGNMILREIIPASVRGFRLAATHLGSGTPSAGASRKVLAKVERMLRSATPPVAREDPAREFRAHFLADESGVFTKLAKIAERLALLSDGGQLDVGELEEAFRLVHTVKGNANALGYAELTAMAHAIEDALYGLHAGNSAATPSALRVVGAKMGDLCAAIDACRRANGAPLASAARPTDVGFYLEVMAGGRGQRIPADTILEVLRKPRVIAVPSTGQTAAVRAVRAKAGFVPLVGSASGAEWVIILRDGDGVHGLCVEMLGSVAKMSAA